MDRKEKFFTFLEALRTDSNSYIVDGVKQAFILTEADDGLIPDDIGLDDDGGDNTATESVENVSSFITIPEMKAVEEFAEEHPEDVKKWVHTVLKPLCKGLVGESPLAEGAEVDYSNEDNDDDKDDEKYGGFESNKAEKIKAHQRRVAEKTN